MNIPNLLTLFRMVSVIPIALLVSEGSLFSLYSALILVAVSYATDGIDGYIARKFGQESKFGAIFDIIGDRVLETCLWLIIASQGLVPSVIGAIFILRGALTDLVRQQAFSTSGSTPFAMMNSPLGKLLVSSRLSRALYGIIKIFTFCFAILVLILKAQNHALYPLYLNILQYLAWITTVFNIVRGLPVLFEAKRVFSK